MGKKLKLRDISGYAEKLARWRELVEQAPRGLPLAELRELEELGLWLDEAEKSPLVTSS